MDIQENKSLLSYNTFGIDVSARHFVEINSTDDLQELAGSKWMTELLILGGGSNVLFTKDYDGLVGHMNLTGYQIEREDDEQVWLRAAAGENWHKLVMNTVDQGWGGIENLSLIPGSVGAAPIQNIGAYGVEFKDVFDSLKAVHLETGEERIFTSSDCDFGYRHSIFKSKDKGKYAITEVTIRLQKKPNLNISYGGVKEKLEEMGVDPSVWAVSEAITALRRSKLPDPKELGNGGSFFKNPVIGHDEFDQISQSHNNVPNYPAENGQVKLAAGWLIEQAGWRGRREGNVGSPEKHALTLVNYGGATGAEVRDLSLHIQADVEAKFGIKLQAEVNII
jgi:UDP-N-acetylmuramate dehydrogenase